MITFLDYITEGVISGIPAKEIASLTDELAKSVYKSEYTFNTPLGVMKYDLKKEKAKIGTHNTEDSVGYLLFLKSQQQVGKRYPIADIFLTIHPISGAKALAVQCWALADLDKVKSLVSATAKRIFGSEKFDIHVKHRSGKGDYDEVSARTVLAESVELENCELYEAFVMPSIYADWQKINKTIANLRQNANEYIWDSFQPHKYADILKELDADIKAFEKKRGSEMDARFKRDYDDAMKLMKKFRNANERHVEPLCALADAVKIGDSQEKVLPKIMKVLKAHSDYFDVEKEEDMLDLLKRKNSLFISGGRDVAIKFQNGKVVRIS